MTDATPSEGAIKAAVQVRLDKMAQTANKSGGIDDFVEGVAGMLIEYETHATEYHAALKELVEARDEAVHILVDTGLTDLSRLGKALDAARALLEADE